MGTICGTSHNNALTLRHGGKGQGACVPWVADTIALEKGSNHTPSPGAELRQGDRLWGPVQWCRECETVIRNHSL